MSHPLYLKLMGVGLGRGRVEQMHVGRPTFPSNVMYQNKLLLNGGFDQSPSSLHHTVLDKSYLGHTKLILSAWNSKLYKHDSGTRKAPFVGLCSQQGHGQVTKWSVFPASVLTYSFYTRFVTCIWQSDFLSYFLSYASILTWSIYFQFGLSKKRTWGEFKKEKIGLCLKEKCSCKQILLFTCLRLPLYTAF